MSNVNLNFEKLRTVSGKKLKFLLLTIQKLSYKTFLRTLNRFSNSNNLYDSLLRQMIVLDCDLKHLMIASLLE